MVEFIEKSPFTGDDFIGNTYVPVYMIKDGHEYFVRNRVINSTDRSYAEYNCKKSAMEVDAAKEALIRNEGTYFCMYGSFGNPLDMLENMMSKGYSLREPESLFIHCDSGFVDFHGNYNEVSGAFFYRIYDMELVSKIKNAISKYTGI